MSNLGTKTNPLRVAIVGSGPAGFYAADHLLKKADYVIEVDMFDRLPTPHGLVRSGVAPDHQKIKTVTKVYDKIASNPNFRFFGLVEFGKDIDIDDLKDYYHQIVFATGTQTDRKMNIPGEELNGNYTAIEFVAWYNGHPYYTNLDFDFSAKRVAIIGIGNVAVDVARILCLSKNELLKTDIADYALEKLSKSRIKEVFMIGRRGPAQAAFTNLEIKELGNLDDADVITIPKEIELDNLTKKHLENNPEKSVERKLEILKNYSINKTTKSKKLYIRFLASPIRIIGDENKNVKTLELVKNKLHKSDDGSLRPRPTNEREKLNVDMIFRSIGYHGTPLPRIPFNEKWGIIPNDNGRIIDPELQKHITGLYVTGWIKRGPTGVIGTNKTDSGETVECMMEDIKEDKILNPRNSEPKEIEKLIKKRNPKFLTYKDWLKIDEKEKERGKKTGRPRVKYTSIKEMLEALKK